MLKPKTRDMMKKLKGILVLAMASAAIGEEAPKKSAEEAWKAILTEQKPATVEAFEFVHNKPDLPNVLLYGDSISIMYTKRVRTLLEGKANVYRLHTNGNHSGKFIELMTEMENAMRSPDLDAPWAFQWDVIHFNVGLHDLKYLLNGKKDAVKGTQVTSIADYQKNLHSIMRYLREMAPDARLVFATTTPVPQNSKGRKHGDDVRYNDAAREVLKGYPEVLVNDLYSLAKPNQQEWWYAPRDVHYNPTGCNALGDQVAQSVLDALPGKGAAAGNTVVNQRNAVITQDPEAVAAGFETRVDALFRAESGKPLVRKKILPPMGAGRGNFSRHYSWSLIAFASRCFYLNEMIDEANAALRENAQHYIDNPKDINDRDSFHWHGEQVMRLIEMYGPKGSAHAGRLAPETEALCLKPIWEYVKAGSSFQKAEYEKSRTWNLYSSENHHVMDFTVHWHFAKYAKDLPEYKDLKCKSGGTLAEHYQAWNGYFLTYAQERARKSIGVEMMSDHYNSVWLKGIYNFRDFGEPGVRKAADMLLDLFWAYWAQEQIAGITGGGKSRISFHEAIMPLPEHGTQTMAWLYFGIGGRPEVHGQDMNAALSDYHPPAVIAAIALDVAGRGRYEIRQQPQGLGKQGRSDTKATGETVPNTASQGRGGILRYSYCDPAFIIGCPMTEARPTKDWLAISAQGRWQGVIFASPRGARIVPTVKPDGLRGTNNQWSAQSKGSLIVQKLKDSQGGKEMIVWMSEAGLSDPAEEGGIVFLEAEAGAYAAVRAVRGGYKFNKEIYTIKKPEGYVYKTNPGTTMVMEDEYSPVIVEVMAKADIGSLEAFKAKVKSCELRMEGFVLHYQTVYGDKMTFDSSYQAIPTINGEPINYAPPKVLESPFLNADYDRGVVTIHKGERKKVLDFNDLK